jgi:hypothetical protein
LPLLLVEYNHGGSLRTRPAVVRSSFGASAEPPTLLRLSRQHTPATGAEEHQFTDAGLEFERKAPTLREAITAAIREVEGAGAGVRVVRVETEAANVIARINADLLGLTIGRRS